MPSVSDWKPFRVRNAMRYLPQPSDFGCSGKTSRILFDESGALIDNGQVRNILPLKYGLCRIAARVVVAR